MLARKLLTFIWSGHVLAGETIRKLLRFGSPRELFGRNMLVLSRVSYALLLIAAAGIVLLAGRSSEAEHWVQHTIDVRADARIFFSDLETAVIRERGYLLTGEESYLGDFSQLLSSLDPRLDQLKKRVADNPAQVSRLTALGPDITLLRVTLDKTVGMKRAGQGEQAVDLVRANRIQEIIKSVDTRLDEFVNTEDRLLVKRQAEAETLQNLLLILIGASLALAATLSVAFEYATRQFVASLRERTSELEAEIKRRRETEATLQQAQKMEAVGQLTGGIAHDFNNLLTVVMGNLDTLKRRLSGTKPEKPQQDFEAGLLRNVEMAQHASRSAAKLTHRLLAFARRQPLEPVRTDCNRLVSEMSEMLRRTLGETIHFETVLGGGLWPTFADPSQLESALLNLAVNAQHAMPAGGHLTIETANAYLDEAYASRFDELEPGQYVQISVADSGTGIPPEILDRVFEPFFTTKATGSGSGLGLAMVHGFAKQSGGHVRIYSEVGHGTTVKMYFPRFTEGAAVAANPGGIDPAAAEIEPARAEETILVVEDNEGVREYACSVLQELGYIVREAADGGEALAIVESGARIDLLFTDVVLPGGMSGRQLSDSVVEMRPGLPVLFTTGYTRNAIVHHGRLDPGVNLLGKPYTQQDLARKLRQLLRAT
jgi:signal transduction histidine kinase/CheY-like chemotaxis protein